MPAQRPHRRPGQSVKKPHFEAQPLLANRRILLPDVVEMNTWGRLLQALGGRVQRFVIGKKDPRALPVETWMKLLLQGAFQELVIANAQGLRLVMELSEQQSLQEELFSVLARIQKVAWGERARAALAEYGLRSNLVFANTAQELEPAWVSANVDLVSAVAASAPDTKLIDVLESSGRSVRFLEPVSRAEEAADQVLKVLVSGGVDTVALCDPSQVNHIWNMAQGHGILTALRLALRRCYVAAVNEKTMYAFQRLGIHVDSLAASVSLTEPRTSDLIVTFGVSVQQARL